MKHSIDRYFSCFVSYPMILRRLFLIIYTCKGRDLKVTFSRLMVNHNERFAAIQINLIDT